MAESQQLTLSPRRGHSQLKVVGQIRLRGQNDAGTQTPQLNGGPGRRSLSLDFGDNSMVIDSGTNTTSSTLAPHTPLRTRSSSSTTAAGPAEVVLMLSPAKSERPHDCAPPLAVSYTVLGDPVWTEEPLRRVRYTTFSYMEEIHDAERPGSASPGFRSSVAWPSGTAPSSPARASPSTAASVGTVYGSRISSFRVYDKASISRVLDKESECRSGREEGVEQGRTALPVVTSYRRILVWHERHTPSPFTTRLLASPTRGDNSIQLPITASAYSVAPSAPPTSPTRAPSAIMPMLRLRTVSVCSGGCPSPMSPLADVT